MKILSRPKPLSRTGGGFSIPELLVYVFLGTLVAAGAATTVITNIRTVSNLELRQRAVDDFGRLNSFLHSEIAEAQLITYPSTDSTALPSQCGPGDLLFIVKLDLESGASNPSTPSTTAAATEEPISFYYTRNNGNDLWRCGVTFGEDGRMELPTTAGTLPSYFDARVNSNTRLIPINTTASTASWALAYTIELRSNSGAVILQRGTTDAPLVARTSIRPIR
jgi:hypothetical protein